MLTPVGCQSYGVFFYANIRLNMLLRFTFFPPDRQVHFGAPTARAAFKHVTVMEEAVEHGGHRSAVTEELSPVLHRTIGSQQGAGPLIAAHDDLQEVLGGGGGEFAHAEIIEVDVAEAEKLPGVMAVMTADDVVDFKRIAPHAIEGRAPPLLRSLRGTIRLIARVQSPVMRSRVLRRQVGS